jgi:arylsulfatase A-like enzyme
MQFLLVFILLCPFVLSAVAAPQPNIIYILCDDLGYGDVGVFAQNQRAARKDRNRPSFATPHIDTLARDGVKLTQHYAGSAVCAPSRASLLTGLTQGHANVRDNQFDKALADTHTISTVLRQAGYATAAFGKWGLQGGDEKDPAGTPAAWPAYPTRRGFDFFFGYVRHKDGHFHYPKEDGREVWENDREISKQLDLCYTTDLFTASTKK